MENQLILLQDLGTMYPTEKSKQKRRYGLYKCFCGNEFKARTDLINISTFSCGCIKKTRMKSFNKTHGLSKNILYNVWKHMIYRCNNPKSKDYENYGGRGIKVCDRWINVENFIKDMYLTYENGLSIDRIDNNKGYSPDNCRWTSYSIQNRNKRKLIKTNTSGYRGVSFQNNINKFIAQIIVNYKTIYLGCFTNPLDAAKAYDQYIIDNNLEHTKNF